MRAVLDIGDEKTGSKSRQMFIHNNKVELLKKGFLSLKSTKVGYYDMGLAAYAGNRHFIKMFKDKNAISENVDLDALLENGIAEEIKGSDSHTVIFSFEGLIRLNSSEISKLTSMLKKYFSEILVFGFFKRQDKWAVSAYTTRLTNRGATDSKVFYYSYGIPRGRNYFKVLKGWASFLPKESLIFYDYDKCGDVVRTFSDVVGMPDNLIFEKSRRNPSMSALGAEVLRRFNKDLSDSNKYKDRTAQVIRRIRQFYVGTPYLPPKNEARKLFKRFSRSNKKLANTLGSNEKYFFSEDFSGYPDKSSKIKLTLGEVEGYIDKALEASSKATFD
ncbi:hypothetical protein QWI17_16055 [Gilvimarinus sp. SDUM040013]|uniref:Uncharacterized protein n=1 Tax=Gilvimarinus gilvus TaxID=3058038 RepID=A0ABU4RVZ1_9GAMM|nr:hypothetical protein [Gilvimarinus sp. SDUM040013]MDO3387355.1 hypothetical protein [Gilvimarinus sp. SDUM040013]MDX6849044.1 hypothetical protein [Gilvimarinus sp. SDUM040013]